MSIITDILTVPIHSSQSGSQRAPEGSGGTTRKYSQGRVYLFISFCFFFLLNLIIAVCALVGYHLEEESMISLVSENMLWALGTFALYVVGGKGVSRWGRGGSHHHHSGGSDNHYNGGPHNNEEEIR